MQDTPAVAVQRNFLDMADECLDWGETLARTADQKRAALDLARWFVFTVRTWHGDGK